MNMIIPSNDNITENDITVSYRVGRRREQTSRPRPYIIRFKEQRKRDLVLSNVPQLSGQVIRIIQDLTKAERENVSEFFKRLDSIKQAGNGQLYKVVGPPGYRKLKKMSD